MINFCIISTDQKTIDSFLKAIRHTLFAINEKEKIKIVPSFEEYIKEEEKTDVLILDLETNPIKDINELNIYKDLFESNGFRIILVSNTNELAVSAFEYGITGFIMKPVDKLVIERFVQKAIIEICKSLTINKSNQADSIVLRNENTYEKVPFFNIAYIEVTKHDVFYHIYKNGIPDRVIKNRNSLKNVKEHLSSTIFISTGINCLVNINYINKILGDDVYIDGFKIHISRSCRKGLLKAFKEYYKR